MEYNNNLYYYNASNTACTAVSNACSKSCENFREKLSLGITCKVGQTFFLTLNVLLELGGAVAHESAIVSILNSSETLFTPISFAKLGVNGAEILFCPRADQSNSCEVRHTIN
jgi:hypothetical protein